MIDSYDYEDYFYTGSHHKYLLFVEQGADVTISPGLPPVVSMESGTPIVITNDNILEEAFELQENFNSSDNWSFGSVEPSMITFDIRENGEIPFLEDKIFRLYMYFDGNSSTMMYIGTYIFDQDDLADDSKSRNISGFDYIQAIRDLDIIDWYRGLFNAHEEPDPEDPDEKIWVPAREKIKVKEARDSLFEYLRDTEGFPILQEEVDLPNDNFEFAFDVDTEALSAGQLLEDLCEINGHYGHLGRRIATSGDYKNYQYFQYISPTRYDAVDYKVGNDVRMNGMMKGLYETASIGRLRVYNRENELVAGYSDGYKKRHSIYNIYENLLIDNITKTKTTRQELKAMMKNIYKYIRYRKYVPFSVKAPADLCREVGDRITLYGDIDVQNSGKSYKTIIFQRRISGIQNMVDEYSAKGDKKLPAFGDYSKSGTYSVKSSGNYNGSGANKGTQYTADGSILVEGVSTEVLVELIRNWGHRLLDEPVVTEITYDPTEGTTSIKWEDPSNLSDEKPVACTWAGTIVVRKEDSAPLNIYQGTVLVDSTTRDQYKTNAFVDTTPEQDKNYFYGIFPYFIGPDGKKWVRFTKVLNVDTSIEVDAPTITDAYLGGTGDWDGSELPIVWSGENNKLTVQISNSTILFKMYSSDTQIYSFTSPVGSSRDDIDKIHVAFLEDSTNEVAKPSFVYHTGTGVYSYNQEDPTDSEMADIYLWLNPPVENQYYLNAPSYGDYRSLQALYTDIVGVVPQSYNWESVSSIIGKEGKVYNLTEILNINDGEAVDDVAASGNVDFTAESKINNIVAEAMHDNSKITVNYTIPAGTYEYIKLCYKRGSIPDEYTEGTCVDIAQDSSSIQLSGIDTSISIYFVIFTDKSSSDPYLLRLGSTGFLFRADLNTDARDMERYDASKTIQGKKQGEFFNPSSASGYTLSDGILDITSYGGGADAKWLYDTSENPRIIPSDCTLTFECDVLFPNQEGYLDWYVYDSSNTEALYLCFDTRYEFQANKWYNCKGVLKISGGKLIRYKYLVDGVEIAYEVDELTPVFPCTENSDSKAISSIYFNLTKRTKFKNISIYYDFSHYSDKGGGDGSGGGTS